MEDFIHFKEMYILQHPSSVPKPEDYEALRVYPRWLKIMVALMFVCAALLSGIHTVPVVRESIPTGGMFSDTVKDAVAAGSFIAVELSIFVTAYALVRKGSKWVLGIMAVCFAVAMVANLYSVSTALAGGDGGILVVSIILGVAAPSITLLAGKLFVDVDKSEVVQQQETRKRWTADNQALDAQIREAYAKTQRRGRTEPVRRTELMDSPVDSTPRLLDTLDGQSMDEFLDGYMNANPGYANNLSVRKLQVQILTDTGKKVSTGKINERQNYWRAVNGMSRNLTEFETAPTSNGNGHPAP